MAQWGKGVCCQARGSVLSLALTGRKEKWFLQAASDLHTQIVMTPPPPPAK